MKSLVLTLLMVPVTLFAANATVDCSGATPGAFTSINAAMATLDAIGPHTVSVSGTCVENAVITSHDRVTLQGAPAATIHPTGGAALRIERSRGAVVRGLTITGPVRGLYVQRNSDALVENVTIEDSGTGLTVDDGSIVNLGGPNAATQSVLIRNNNFGARVDGGTVWANGNVTIENNAAGMDAEHSRIGFIGSVAAPNIVRDNAGNGVFGHGGSDISFRGVNQVTGNGLNGIFAFESSVLDVIGNATQTTTVDGNLRGGVVFIFNSSGRVQNAIVTNNGSATNPLSSGVTVANNSSAIVSSSTITGTTGPGVIVDSGSMARIFDTTIGGGTAEPIRLITGGILELQTGNTITGVGKHVVLCDDSAVLFGEGANVTTNCKKTK
ncbi:MAG: right-handed parallel beta-helix repeat-containing protein [Thermoanaerobaculia bacterium]